MMREGAAQNAMSFPGANRSSQPQTRHRRL